MISESRCRDFYSLSADNIPFDFFPKENFSRVFCGSVYVDFDLLQEVFFDRSRGVVLNSQFSLVEAEDNAFKIFYSNEDNSQLLWYIDIDAKFSSFSYKISQKTTSKDKDFGALAFNRFLLQHTFINHHGLIIHAAGGSISGKGMVFPAVSGTGKSTLSHLLLPFSENQLFSEERIIMRRLDDGWHLWGTPWKGTGSIARNESAPLSALVFLSQAPETKITPLSTSAALRRLLETVSIPWYSQEWTDKGLAVCESLLRDIPAFELAFRPDETAVQAVADFAASLP